MTDVTVICLVFTHLVAFKH